MEELKVLTIDYNPIVYPPREITEFNKAGEVSMYDWLLDLKNFLNQNLDKQNGMQNTEESGSR